MLKTLPNKSGVYIITNTKNNKSYIGCASNIRTRINGHFSDLNKNIHPNVYFQRSWNKYSKECFIVNILELCDKSEKYKVEHFWVSKLETTSRNKGYNLKNTDPFNKPIISEETRLKISIANKGRKPSLLCIEKLKERKVSNEHKIKLLNSRKHIDFKSLHRKLRGKKIINVLTKERYQSISEVCELLSITKSTLSRKLSNKRFNNTPYQYI